MKRSKGKMRRGWKTCKRNFYSSPDVFTENSSGNTRVLIQCLKSASSSDPPLLDKLWLFRGGDHRRKRDTLLTFVCGSCLLFYIMFGRQLKISCFWLNNYAQFIHSPFYSAHKSKTMFWRGPNKFKFNYFVVVVGPVHFLTIARLPLPPSVC